MMKIAYLAIHPITLLTPHILTDYCNVEQEMHHSITGRFDISLNSSLTFIFNPLGEIFLSHMDTHDGFL